MPELKRNRTLQYRADARPNRLLQFAIVLPPGIRLASKRRFVGLSD
jgi:hypothetical protein